MRGKLLGVAAAVCVCLPATANAATIAPDTTADDFGTDMGHCSLREAVQAAQTDGDFGGCSAADEDDDVIELQSGQTYTLSIPDATNDDSTNAIGDIDIAGNGINDQTLTIQSSGADDATIDANGTVTHERVLQAGVIPSGFITTVTLSNLRLTGGAPEPLVAGGGGAILTSQVQQLTIEDSAIAGNVASIAGAIQNDYGNLTITDTSIHSNNASAIGAIYSASSSTVTAISGSTISGNNATDPGSMSSSGFAGAIYVGASNTTTITNSTVYGNTTKTDGGGIYNAGTLNLRSSTVASNTADSDASGTAGDGGGLYAAGTENVRNSLIADNADLSSPAEADCSGPIASEGYNLIESTTGCTGTAGTDISGSDPNLDAMDANGGPTELPALLTPSPAINAANPATPGGAPPACPAVDQRGYPRDATTAACDIGAFEKQPPTLTAIGNKTVQAGQLLSFTTPAADPDPFDTLAYQASNLPPGASYDTGTHAFSWTPTASDVGSHAGVGFAVNDGVFNDNESIDITVTAAPPPPPPDGGGPVSAPPATKKKKCKKPKKRAAPAKKCKRKRR